MCLVLIKKCTKLGNNHMQVKTNCGCFVSLITCGLRDLVEVNVSISYIRLLFSFTARRTH